MHEIHSKCIHNKKNSTIDLPNIKVGSVLDSGSKAIVSQYKLPNNPMKKAPVAKIMGIKALRKSL